MKSEIKTIIFDCFGVICGPVLNGWYQEKRVKNGFVDDNLQNVFKEFDLGKLSEDDLLNYFLKYDGLTLTKEELRKEIDSFLKLDDELEGTIRVLKQKGFKIILLSNANHSFFERMIYPTYPEFKSLFDKIIISSEVGMIKPNADIYLHALAVSNSKPAESLFVDDSKTNVQAAIGLGIHGYLYTDRKSFIEYAREAGLL